MDKFDSRAFGEDVVNAACDYCADGIDAFERCLQSAPLLEPEIVLEIQKGTLLLGQELLGKMQCNLSLFQQFCTATVFSVPFHANINTEVLAPPLAMLSPARFPSQSEAELDSKLAMLREQLLQVNAETSQLQQDVGRLDRDISEHSHLAKHTAALASSLNISVLPSEAGQQGSLAAIVAPGVAASVAAIAAAVEKLQPLLLRAQRLRAKRQPLVAVQEASVAVEFKSSQMSKACGTLQDMQALQKMLNVV